MKIKEEHIDTSYQDLATYTSMISSLIKDEWEAIDGYNGAILTISALDGKQDAIDIMNDIIKEEYVHIGQLEKLIQNIVPDSNEIESGVEEAEEVLEEPVEAPIEEALEEPIMIKTKSVKDTDGFTTDYTMYKDGDKYIFILGDTELYGPKDTEPDWEAYTEEEANEWFDSYGGDDEIDELPPDDVDESLAEKLDFSKKEVEDGSI